jgi:PAT family acetyl-CoA transporter-like MFS transporter 1
MLLGAAWAEDALHRADIASVTAVFFVLVLLAATQDIAVDGWALTLLSRKHVGCADPPSLVSPTLHSPPSSLSGRR